MQLPRGGLGGRVRTEVVSGSTHPANPCNERRGILGSTLRTHACIGGADATLDQAQQDGDAEQ